MNVNNRVDTASPYFDIVWNANDSGFYSAVAKCDLPKHTLIWTEEPMLQGDQIWNAMPLNDDDDRVAAEETAVTTPPRTRAEDEDYLTHVVGLDPAQHEQFWQLHDQFHAENEKRLWGIITTNSFCNRDLDMAPACYWVVARGFNHSCQPNVGLDFVGTTQRLWTARNVSAGQELTIAYNDVIFHHTTAVRRAYLLAKCQFHCLCKGCTRTSDALVESDNRRRKIAHLAQSISFALPQVDFLYNVTFEEGIHATVVATAGLTIDKRLPNEYRKGDNSDPSLILEHLFEYINLVTMEEIDHDMLDCYRLAYNLAVKVGNNEKQMRDLGQQCLDHYRIHKGEHHEDVKLFRAELQARNLYF